MRYKIMLAKRANVTEKEAKVYDLLTVNSLFTRRAGKARRNGKRQGRQNIRNRCGRERRCVPR